MNSGSKRKTILPLHIDTTSFTNGQTQNNTALWRKLTKRQFPLFLLLTILFFSLFLNLIQHNKLNHNQRSILKNNEIYNNHDPLPPILLNENNHAIIIAGHAIYKGTPNNMNDISNDENWILEPYQKGGQVKTFIQHIQTGVDLLKQDSKAVLVFSG